MSDLKELVVKLVADASGYDRGTKKAVEDNEKIKKSSGGLKDGFLKGAAGALGFIGTAIGVSSVSAAIGFVTDAIGGTIEAASESQAVMAQTNNVLQSTHGISGQTAQSISDLAGKYQLLTGIDDEAVQGAENMIATFTNIRGNVFPQTTKAVLDMATAMNGGAVPSAEQLRQTAIQVGKALNDPVQGVQALQRVGVKLSATQMDQVKHFMAVGDVASAQKVILGELSTEFGGAAEAAGGTFAGKLATAKGELQNVQEAIGGALLPVLTKLLNAVAPIVAQFAAQLPGAIQTVQTQITPFVAKIGDLIGNLTKNKPLMDGLQSAFANLKPLIGPVLIALGILTAISFAPLAILIGVILGIVLVLKKLWEITEPVRTALGNLFGAIGEGIQKAQAVFRQGVENILELLSHIPGPAGDAARGVLNSMKAADDATKAHTESMKLHAAMNTAQMAEKTIANLEKQKSGILKQIQETKDPAKRHMLEMKLQSVEQAEDMQRKVVEQAQQMAQKHGAQMKLLADKSKAESQAAKNSVVGRLGEMKDQALGHIGDFIGGALAFFGSLPGKIGGFLGMVLGKIGGFIGSAISNFLSLPGKIGHAIDLVKSAVQSKIDDVKALFKAGLDRITGFFSGLKLAFPNIKLPHFSITGSFNLNPPSVPHLDIQWYKTGGIFNGPQVIGVGEAGPEAVIPLDRLSSTGGGNGNGGGAGGSGQPVVLNIDGRALARVLLPHMVNEIRTSAGIRSL